MSILKKISTYLELVKFQHTIFALPFAVLSAFLAAGGFPGYATIGWILMAMVGARSAAMSFNRLMDEKYDRDNPRTASRPLTAGLLRRNEVWAFTAASIVIFVWAAYSLNRLAFLLSPVALAVILSYSIAKRFTSMAHLWLGLGLAIAPVGAWIAVTGEFGVPPLWLALAVMLWTAGFDIIYSCMDYDFDVKAGLHSVPSRLGIPKALRLSAFLHLGTLAALAAFLWFAGLGVFSWVGLGLVACLLAYEHWLVRPNDLGQVNAAFFHVNAVISFGMMCTAMLDIYL